MHVDVKQWFTDLVQNAGDDWSYTLMNAVRGLHNGAYFTVTSRYPVGTNIYERDWDLLLVFDACRVDAMREVAPEYDFIESVDSIWSVGSSSHEWLCKTFTRDYIDDIRETVYLSTNPNTPITFEDGKRPAQSYSIPLMWADWDVVDDDDFQLLWQLPKGMDDEGYITLGPEEVTDYTIHTGRDNDFGRMVVHYFQPHRPYIAGPYRENRPPNDLEEDPWSGVKSGRATKEEIWELYIDNLRVALDSIERLLENIDAEKVVLTADHGDLFGELGIYGHPEGFPHPNLKKVPWVETTATDTMTSEPTVDTEREQSSQSVQEQLEQLGYL